MTQTFKAAKASVAILLVFALTACATKLGRDFDEAYAQQIKPGETTKEQLLQKLGKPPLRGGPADGETWTYAYYKGRGVGLSMFDYFVIDGDELQYGTGDQKRLVVVFNGDVVKTSRFTKEIPVPR